MTTADDLQLAHFGSIDHATRFEWQTRDPFVMEREFAVMCPLFECIRSVAMQKGSVDVLESGCGEGVNMQHLQMMGLGSDVRIKGVDFCPEAVMQAQRVGLDAVCADGLRLPFADGTFDIVFCHDVLHHLPNDVARQRFFEEMKRAVRPGGFMFAIEPNAWNICIFGLSILVPAERGLQQITEPRIRSLLPGCGVMAASPSAVWRFLYHYHSPVHRSDWIARVVRRTLKTWEAICRRLLPTRFWAYRVYRWKSP